MMQHFRDKMQRATSSCYLGVDNLNEEVESYSEAPGSRKIVLQNLISAYNFPFSCFDNMNLYAWPSNAGQHVFYSTLIFN